MVQSARATNFSVSLSISVKPGYVFNLVKEELTNNLKEFADSLEIGRSVYETDIADVIYHTEGVDRYFLSFSDLSVSPGHYANLTSVIVTERSS